MGKKAILIIILVLTVFLSSIYAQADYVTGTWLTEESDSKIEIVKISRKY